MATYFEGATELDGGPLSALSEAYLTTNPCGMFIVVHFEGEFDADTWDQSLAYLRRSYPLLASVILERLRRGLYQLDRRPLADPGGMSVHFLQNSDTQAYLREHLMKPFDLFAEAPVRFFLLKRDTGCHSLVFNAHHSAADGVTVLNLLRDLFVYYHQLKAGKIDYTGSLFNNHRMDSPIKSPAFFANLKSICAELMERKRRPLIWRKRNLKSIHTQATIRSFCLTSEQTDQVMQNSRRLGLSINDLLNVEIIKTIEKIRPRTEGLLSACVPVNLRPYIGQVGRYANLTSGMYINLRPRDRQCTRQIAETFVSKRKALLRQGRPVANLQLLQNMFRILRLFPQKRRRRWLEKRGSYPASYLCSNLGQAVVMKKESDHSSGGVIPVLVRDWEVMISPNRNVDYSVFALTLSGNLKIFISTDDTVLGTQEPERFQQQFQASLTG